MLLSIKKNKKKTIKSIKRVAKIKERKQTNLLAKTKIETVIEITPILLLGSKVIINIVKSDSNLIKTR